MIQVILRRCCVLLGLLTLAVTLGCGSETKKELPAMYPASGTIHYRDGKPVPGGFIELNPKKDLGFNVTGDVSNGNFTLYVRIDGEKKDGAPDGEYRVTWHPPPGESQEVQPEPIAQTVVVKKDGPNKFALKLRTNSK